MFISSASEPRTQDLTLAGQSGERFLATHAELIAAAKRVSAPYRLSVTPERHALHITGDNAAVLLAARVLAPLAADQSHQAATHDATRASVAAALSETLLHDFVFRLNGLSRPVQPKSLRQVAFLQSLLSQHEQLVIGIGPTGTGKTHLALAAALAELAEERVKRVVVTRPHILMDGEVVTPSLRREMEYDDQFEYLEDMLRDLIGYSQFHRLVDERKLELMPLGHFRGRTFNDTYIVVDEAQNMTVRKMRMAVTRLGRASRIALTGDPTHVDLKGEPSGLVHLMALVGDSGIATVHQFEADQIIRNSLVSRLEQLYARDTGGKL